MVQVFVETLFEVFTFPILFYVILGSALGLIFGAIPGLGGSAAIALLVPITFGWDSHDAFFLLGSLVGGVSFGGAITAILINTPGTASNAASLLDGYPMTRQGRSAEAIGIAGIASALGSVIGVAILLALLPLSRQMILAFSYPELFMVTAIGIAMIALVSTGSMIKGLISGTLGLFLSMIGRSPMSGQRRFDFGSLYLSDGLPLIPILIGLFALAEAVRLLAVNRGGSALTGDEIPVEIGGRGLKRWNGILAGAKPVLKNPRLLVQSSVIGTVTGIVPAVGGSVAGFVAYASAKQTVKDSSKFGYGDERGLVATEASNDAKDGGAVLPTVMFGLPGSPAWAVMLGALLIHGVAPGRDMLTTRLDVTMVLIVALLASSLLSTVMGLALAPWATGVVKLPSMYTAPLIFITAIIGAYAARGRPEDMLVVTIAGVAGYFLKKNGFSLIPVVIGLVLGRTLEITYNQTLTVQGLTGFVTRPISLGILVVGVFGIGWSIYKNAKTSKEERKARQAAVLDDEGGSKG